jgi:hypothetical protein
MQTATAVLSTLSTLERLPRKQAELANSQLVILGDFSSDFTVKLLAQGVRYADSTGRIGGTLSMALRRATPWQAAQLVAAMLRDGLSLQSEVPAWLNANGLALLAA